MEEDDVDMTAPNLWCSNCSFVTSSEEKFETHKMRCANSEEALQNIEVEVKMTDFALRAHSEKRARIDVVANLTRHSKKLKEEGIAFRAKLLEEDNGKLHMKNSTLKKTTEDQKKLHFFLGESEPQHSHAQPSPDLKTTPTAIKISPEHLKVVITEMSLSSLVLGDYLVIVKSDFDMVISDEPYLALMLLLDTMTGKYIARIWNQTVSTGIISSVDQLKAACMKHFEHRPCIGFPVPENEHGETGFDLMVSQAPVLSNKVSKSCLRMLSKDVSSEIMACSECLRLKHLFNPKKRKLEAIGQSKKLSGVNLTKTTEPTEKTTRTKNMPWGSGLRAKVVEDKTRDRWLQEYNNSENFPLRFVSDTEIRCEACDNNFTAYQKNIVQRHCESRSHCSKNILKVGREGGQMQYHVLDTTYKKIQEAEASDESGQYDEGTDFKEEFEEIEEDDAPVIDQSNESDEAIGVTQGDNIQKKNVRTNDKIARPSSNRKGFPKKCTFCEKVLNTGSSYRNHRRYKHYWGSFTCSKCKFKANFAEDLIEHMKQQNHTEEPVLCPSCQEEYDMTEIDTHYKKCLSIFQSSTWARARSNDKNRKVVPKKCTFCEKVFNAASSYRDHMRFKHHRGSFTCSKCKFTANFIEDLIEHIKQQNHTEEPVICPCCQEEYAMTEIVTHYKKCLSILKAEQRRRWNGAERYRIRKARGLTDEEIAELENELQTKKSQERVPSSPKKCPMCEKEVTSLWRHKVLLHNVGRFKCLKCGFRASFAKDIVEHMKEQNHVDEPLVRCPSCKEKHHMTEIASHYEGCPKAKERESKKIVNKMQINEKGEVGPWQRNGKEEIFPRKCSFCDSILQTRFTYKNHIRTVHHGGNFTCLKCKIRAVFPRHLVQHMEEEGHTEEPFVVCPRCCDKHHMKDIVAHYEDCITKAYKSEYKPKRKMCPTCGKNVTSYSQHKKIHLREKGGNGDESLEFYCDQCGKQFLTKQGLRGHVQAEHEKKEFECKTCEQTFKSAGKLSSHRMSGIS